MMTLEEYREFLKYREKTIYASCMHMTHKKIDEEHESRLRQINDDDYILPLYLRYMKDRTVQ